VDATRRAARRRRPNGALGAWCLSCGGVEGRNCHTSIIDAFSNGMTEGATSGLAGPSSSSKMAPSRAGPLSRPRVEGRCSGLASHGSARIHRQTLPPQLNPH
jgi:hypothetical protein